MPQRILGLDVGSWSVKGVLVEDRLRGFRLIRTHEVPLSPGPAETLRERQIEAIGALVAKEPEKVDAFVASVSGERTAIRFVELPYTDAKKIAQTIGGEIADALPFDLDDAAFAHEVVHKMPAGGSLSVAAAVKAEHIRATLDLLDEAGVEPKYLCVDHLSLYNLYTHFVHDDASKAEPPGLPAPEPGPAADGSLEGPPDARLILDIGHERTLLCAAGAQGIAYVRAIRGGGADVTRALMRVLEATEEQAENLKHEEGFIASSRHPAPDDRSQEMSDIVAEGLSPLLRELRRSLLAIRSERRARIVRIDVLGGGSRIRNLPNYLAEQLNVSCAPGLAVEQIVEREVDAARRSAFASGLALALRTVGDQAVSRIDLRVGEFEYAGSLQHLRSRVPAIAVCTAALILLLIANFWANYRTSSMREKSIDAQFCLMTKEVIGQEICEPKRAISAMQSPTSELGNVAMPERSALNIAAELSDRIPKELDVHIHEMQIQPGRAKISGETTTFDAVDTIVAEYGKDPCYTDIKKGKLQRMPSGNRIEFVLTIQLECT